MTERNTVVLKSPNQVVKQTGDKKRWGAIYKVAKTTECFTELKCVRTQIFSSKLTDIHFSISTLWSFSILQLIHTYTPGLRKMTRLHTYTHTHAYIHPHTCIHTDTHTRTHTHTHTHSRVKNEALVWMLLGDLTVSPIWISCKVHITDKMASVTHVRAHWLRLLNQTYCSWHQE